MNSSGIQSARLYVGGLTLSVQQKDVENLFAKFGKILEVRMNRNFAFVQFSEDSEAQAAIKEINGTTHFGRRIDVQVARHPKAAGGPGGGGPPKGDDMMPGRDGRDRSPIGGGRGGGRGGMGGGRGGFRGGDRGGPMFNSGGGRGGFDEPNYGGRGGNDFRSEFRGGGGDFPQSRQDGPPPFGRSEGGGGGGGPTGGLFGPSGGREFSLAPPTGFRGEGRPDSGGVGKPWGNVGGGGGPHDRPGGGGGGGGGYGALNENAFDSRGRGGDMSQMPYSQQERPPTHPIEPVAISNNERTNDIEIIIVDKSLTEYGEMIERRMSCLGFSVDVLFPHEAVPLARVLGNIASRGTLYAVVITHVHQINGSLTLHILHGRPQEHRNMAIDDAITLLLRNYESYTRSCREKSAPNTPPEQVRHLLTQVLNGRPLTTTQYDILVQFLLQEKLKLEPQGIAGRDSQNTSAQAELQTRILSILNKTSGGNEIQQHPPPLQPTGPLLQDPSIQKALDSLMQGGDLLRKIAPHPTAPFGIGNASPQAEEHVIADGDFWS